MSTRWMRVLSVDFPVSYIGEEAGKEREKRRRAARKEATRKIRNEKEKRREKIDMLLL